MARKLQLKTVTLNSGLEGEFDYGAHLLAILRWDQQTGGMTFDDVVRRTQALAPIQKAINEKADEVVLSDEQWITLKEKFDRFQFRFADLVIVEFGNMIRNAPEIGA
jgi:hypothetical protein